MEPHFTLIQKEGFGRVQVKITSCTIGSWGTSNYENEINKELIIQI